MNASDHLKRNQIAAFSAGSLAASETRNVGGHLIRCVDCRRLLPIPDASQVWRAIESEHDINETRPMHDSSTALRLYSQTLIGLFGKRNRLAWAGGMLVVVFSLAVLFIFTVSNERNVQSDVARSLEIDKPMLLPSHDQSVGISLNNAGPSGPEIKGADSMSANRRLAEARRKPSPRIAPSSGRASSGLNRSISSTRGTIAKCEAGRTVEMELGSSKTDLVLRWNPVSSATKYHLYISDDSEVLVDEFETERDTSYVLKKSLDPTKSYRWKIVITLESGQTLYVDAQNFTAKDFRSYFNGQKNKAGSSTRCLENE